MLKKGNLIRISVKFRGREIDHPDIGLEKLQTLWTEVENDAIMSVKPNTKGNEIFIVVNPKNENKNNT